jgi:hypothetical protein
LAYRIKPQVKPTKRRKHALQKKIQQNKKPSN